MLWIKAFHIFFVVSWYAGLLYLPRLFVYHNELWLDSPDDDVGHQRFIVMERRLFAIMTVGAIGSVFLGLWLWIGYWLGATAGSYWMHAKLLLVGLLLGFHLFTWRIHQKLRVGQSGFSTKALKLINEVPAVMLIVILIMVVVKPI